jgi:hypothetical protein
MTKIPNAYNLPENLNAEMSDAEIKERLLSDFKQQEVKKSNFPTEVVPLPSRGLLYPEGHPLSDGFIEMKYMTAKEEDILTSQNLIKQGVVLDKLFESLIVTPVNYGDIYSGDKNAIMVAARLLGYGNDYTVEIDDPFSPGTKQKVTIDLSQIEHKEVDYSLFENRKNEFDFELPNSKRVVTFRLMTHALEKQIETEIKASYMKQISPDLDMSFTFISDATGEVKELDIPMDVSFFWPNS